jgi:RNA polymerase sigma factor (sigma-70 family)
MADTKPTKEFEVTVIVRNNRLKKRRVQLGLTQPDMADLIGIPMSVYARFEKLQLSPFDKDGNWRTHALALCDFFHTTPWELFPDAVVRFGETAVGSTVVREVAAENLDQLSAQAVMGELPAPDAAFDAQALLEATEQALAVLTPKERTVIEYRFGLSGQTMTYTEIGRMLDLSHSRIAQIECEALRKLSHPCISRILRPHLADESYDTVNLGDALGEYQAGAPVWVNLSPGSYRLGYVLHGPDYYEKNSAEALFYVQIQNSHRLFVRRHQMRHADSSRYTFDVPTESTGATRATPSHATPTETSSTTGTDTVQPHCDDPSSSSFVIANVRQMWSDWYDDHADIRFCDIAEPSELVLSFGVGGRPGIRTEGQLLHLCLCTAHMPTIDRFLLGPLRNAAHDMGLPPFPGRIGTWTWRGHLGILPVVSYDPGLNVPYVSDMIGDCDDVELRPYVVDTISLTHER